MPFMLDPLSRCYVINSNLTSVLFSVGREREVPGSGAVQEHGGACGCILVLQFYRVSHRTSWCVTVYSLSMIGGER